jgi:hypothetical protein
MASEAPKVLISYSHDSLEHVQHVLALAERLRQDGIEAQLDQYVSGTPARGWPRWTEDQLDSAEFVLVVCTETYRRRFLGREEPNKGKGADWEGSLITLELYHNRSDTSKFVPVLFDHRDEPFIPRPLSGHSHYLLNSEDSYANLYAFLTGQAGVAPRELGSLKTLAHSPAEPLSFDSHSNLPGRNPLFTGREQVLAELRDVLAGQGRAALSGLGGVGKTQAGLEYAYRHLNEYLYTLWSPSDSLEALVSSYGSCTTAQPGRLLFE